MEKFENVIVAYMLGQGRMAFAVVHNYPVMTIVDGRMVEDRSECGQEIKAQAREGYELMCRIQDRQKRGIRIPRTWVARLSKLETFVMALRQCRNITEEWAEEFFRSLRWLRTLEA